MFRRNDLKHALLAGRPAFGVTHTLAHAPTAELLGLAGCDFVLVDDEHGQGDRQQHLACLQALAATGAHGIVRLTDGSHARIKHILDLGAEGVMVPNVATARQARDIVAACRYPPRGTRGNAAAGVRASDYGLRADRYMAEIERELLIAVIIESAEGVRNAAEIAAVDGIDLLQVGANDLSYDLGLGGAIDHPDLAAAIARTEDGARAAGKALGGAPLPGMDVAGLIARGYTLITIGRDAGLLVTALRGQLERARTAPRAA